MLNKIAVVSVGLLALAGMSAAYCQGAPAAPSIMDLEAFARAAESTATGADRQIAEAEEFFADGHFSAAQHIIDLLDPASLTPEQAGRVGRLAADIKAGLAARTRALAAEAERQRPEKRGVKEQASDLLDELHRDWVVQKELDRQASVELAQRAHEALYYERNPRGARDLAQDALGHDSTNLQAQEILTQARVELGDEEAIQKIEIEVVDSLPELRRESAIQTLANSRAAAQRYYAEGEYALALEELRRALTSVEALSVYMDVQKDRQQIEGMIRMVERDYDEYERRLAAERRLEADETAEQWARDAAAQDEKARSRRVDEVARGIQEAQFDEVEAMLGELMAEDPSDELPVQMQRDAIRKRAAYEMDRINQLREDNRTMLDVFTAGMEVLPRHIRTWDYPDMVFWKRVAEKRDPQLYPSIRGLVGRRPEDLVVHEQLEESFLFDFDGVGLDQVLEYLDEVTPVTYLPVTTDVPPDATVTFRMETDVKTALDQVCAQLNLGWDVENGIVRIAAAERLRKYDHRIYPMADLMTSFRDFTTSDIRGAGGRGGRGGGRTGGGGGGFNPQFSFFDGDAGRDALPARRTGGGGTAGGGRGGQQDTGVLLPEASSLIVLIKELCGRETWRRPDASGIIDEGVVGAGAGRRGAAGAQAGPVGPVGPLGPGGFGEGPAAGLELAPAAAVELGPSGEVFVLAHDPTQFIIYQTADVHTCIEKLLQDLRARRTIMISVDARTIAVDWDFMREVGFEWEDFALADQSLTSGPWDSVSGVGITTGSDRGFGTFIMPEGYEVVWVPDPTDPTSGEYQAYTSGGPQEWLGWLGADLAGGVEADPVTGAVTFTKPYTEGLTSAVGTGLPWIADLQRFGTQLNVGWQNDLFHLAGFFRMAHKHHALTTTQWMRMPLVNGQANEMFTETEQWYISNYTVEESVLIPELASAPSGSGFWARAVVGPDLKYVWVEMQPRGDRADLSQTADFVTWVGQPGGGDGGAAGEAVVNTIVLPSESRPDVQAVVVCPDRGTVVIGGTVLTERVYDEAGVPILDKIPILKRLFSSKGERVKTDTVFHLVRPQIILMDEEERRVK